MKATPSSVQETQRQSCRGKCLLEVAPSNVRDGGGIAKLPLLSPSRVTRLLGPLLVNCVSEGDIGPENLLKLRGTAVLWVLLESVAPLARSPYVHCPTMEWAANPFFLRHQPSSDP